MGFRLEAGHSRAHPQEAEINSGCNREHHCQDAKEKVDKFSRPSTEFPLMILSHIPVGKLESVNGWFMWDYENLSIYFQISIFINQLVVVKGDTSFTYLCLASLIMKVLNGMNFPPRTVFTRKHYNYN